MNRIAKRLFSVFAVVALLALLLPGSVFAASVVIDHDNGAVYANGNSVVIKDDGGKTVVTDGASVTYSEVNTSGNGNADDDVTGYTIYGGSQDNSYTGPTSVAITSGSLGAVFGGNKGEGQADTTAALETSVVITGGTMTGNIYGGNELGNLSGATSVSVSNVSASTITVFGGSKGNYTVDSFGSNQGGNPEDGENMYLQTVISSQTGNITGNTSVTVSGSTLANVYGGGWKGEVIGNTTVNVVDSTVSTYTTPANFLAGGYVVGGGKYAGIDGTANVTIAGSSSMISGVLGGSNYWQPATVTVLENANVTLAAGTINGNIYSSGYSNVEKFSATVTGGRITVVYGGGLGRGSYTKLANIVIDSLDGDMTYLLGNGQNSSSHVDKANITINSTGNFTIREVGCGAGNGSLDEQYILINGGNITDLEAGISNNTILKSTVEVAGGTIGTVYGGAWEPFFLYSSVVEESVLIFRGGTVGAVYGGGYDANTVNDLKIYVQDGAVIGELYVGGVSDNWSSVDSKVLNAAVEISGGSITSGAVYGHGTTQANTVENLTMDLSALGAKDYVYYLNNASAAGIITLSGDLRLSSVVLSTDPAHAHAYLTPFVIDYVAPPTPPVVTPPVVTPPVVTLPASTVTTPATGDSAGMLWPLGLLLALGLIGANIAARRRKNGDA